MPRAVQKCRNRLLEEREIFDIGYTIWDAPQFLLRMHVFRTYILAKKSWIRFVTVLGYIFFVSLPAVSLSIYYVYIWDPGYINKVSTYLRSRTSSMKSVVSVPSRHRQHLDNAQAADTLRPT
ncbi:unnamed protein product [Heligmosomoides polygyrus]|uniref:Uncharacterized protein n=1 Tax=Heligmosomoides polygyrus TaxID=6339 RepID=A0A3P8CDM9_HELPZ|nr:unnamed protein product [Heligmosomoides polygyrus]